MSDHLMEHVNSARERRSNLLQSDTAEAARALTPQEKVVRIPAPAEAETGFGTRVPGQGQEVMGC